MKYKVFAVLSFLFLAVSCTKQAKNEEKKIHDTSLAKIIVKKELVVGMEPSIPPLSFYANTGKLIGYEVDVAKEIAKRLGVDLKIVPVGVENKFSKLENRSVDYLASTFLAKNDPRRFLLSKPYLRDALVVIVAENSNGESPFKEFHDLRNKRVGVLADEVIVKYLLQSPLYTDNNRQPYTYTQMEKLLIALDYGQLEAAVINLLTYYSKVTKEKKTYRIVGDPLTINTYSYVFREDDHILHETIDMLLLDLAKDSTLRTLSNKWFGADVSTIGKY